MRDQKLRQYEWILEYTEQQEVDMLLALLESALGAVELIALSKKGTMLTEDQAIEEALRT